MPDMDGMEVLQQIRGLNPDQPVVIFTGSVSAEQEHGVRALGANDIIEKEFPSHRLLDMLKRLVKVRLPLLCA
jgi:two-component system, NtrC family, C4-dicarboxylate transport response regulator DctD